MYTPKTYNKVTFYLSYNFKIIAAIFFNVRRNYQIHKPFLNFNETINYCQTLFKKAMIENSCKMIGFWLVTGNLFVVRTDVVYKLKNILIRIKR